MSRIASQTLDVQPDNDQLDVQPDVSSMQTDNIPSVEQYLHDSLMQALAIPQGVAQVGANLHNLLASGINYIGNKTGLPLHLSTLTPDQTQYLSNQTMANPMVQSGQQLGEAAGYAGLGGAGSLALDGVGFLGPYLSNMLSGSAVGAIGDPNSPGTGALEGSALGAVGPAISDIYKTFSGQTPSILQPIQNMILRSLNKNTPLSDTSDFNPILSRQAAAKKLNDYLTLNGQQAPIDIGSLTNNSGLQKLYEATGYVPGSGTVGAQNMVNRAGVKINLNDVLSQLPGFDINSNINDYASSLHNSLLNNITPGNDLKSTLINAIKTPYNNYKMINNEIWNPINQSADLNLTGLAQSNKLDFLPNYARALNSIDTTSTAYKNIFGNDQDLDTGVKQELNSGMNAITGTPLTLGDYRTRTQALGNLVRTAGQSGNRVAQAQLLNLKNSLDNDTKNLLQQNGYSDLANQLNTANSYYKNNIVPFYNSKNVSQIVSNQPIVQGNLENTLSKEILNNDNLKNILPNDTLNLSLFKQLAGPSGSNYDSNLNSTINGKQLASNYANLSDNYKNTLQSINPDLSDNLNELNNAYKSGNLENLQEQYLKVGKSGQDMGRKIIKGSELGALGVGALFHPVLAGIAAPTVGLAARGLSSALRDPELIQNYLSGANQMTPAINPLHPLIQGLLNSLNIMHDNTPQPMDFQLNNYNQSYPAPGGIRG